MAEEGKRQTPAYVTWGSLETLLNHFEATDVPLQIDVGYLENERGVSNSYAKQIILSLRFLGWIDDAGSPTDRLRALVPRQRRQSALYDALHQTYGRIFETGIDLSHVSRDDLEQVFADQYGVKGGTANRAATFFVGAARYAGIPLPEAITDRRRAQDTVASNKSAGKTSTGSSAGAPADDPAITRSENRKTITLRSAGSVSMTVIFPIFEIDKHDRDFVLDLIDRLQRYEREMADANEAQSQQHDDASVDGRAPIQQGLATVSS